MEVAVNIALPAVPVIKKCFSFSPMRFVFVRDEDEIRIIFGDRKQKKKTKKRWVKYKGRRG